MPPLNLGLLIYGSLDTRSGGYLYDRRLVESLRAAGETVQVISLPWRHYAAHLTDNLRFRLPPGLDLLIQDELNHPSLIAANASPHPYPVVSLVHHLRCSEARPRWQNALYRRVERRYLRSVDGFIYNSETTRGEVERLLPLPGACVVARPPTDRFGLRVTEAEVTLRARRPGLRIAFLGNIIPRKGLHTLLEALRELPASFRLDVIGSPRADPAYARRMERLAAGLPVRFHGALEEEALAGLLREAQILALPSSQEGFGIAWLEGMGFGLPALARDAGAAAEVITDGETGLLLPAADPHVLAEALRRLDSDRGLLEHLSLAARLHFLRQPAWESSVQAIRRFLQTML